MAHPLQSKEWEEFRKAWGNETVRVSGNLLTLHKIPFIGKVAIFEKGSLPSSDQLQTLNDFGKKENLVFIKLEPAVPPKDSQEVLRLTTLLRKRGATPGKTLFTPTTFWIDLTRAEDDILKSFHSKTRYNIRVAQRNGVQVKEDNSNKAFEDYLRLMRETVQRDKFYAHTEKYHRLMWKFLNQQPISNNKKPIAHLLTAIYQGEITTAWILFAYEDFLYYPYGASTHKFKNVMANNLMMWEAIRFGKKLGLKTFDLWGREEGKGFTKFKEGYNPKVIEFLGTWDLVINKPLYWLYRVTELIRWTILRTMARLGLSKYSF